MRVLSELSQVSKSTFLVRPDRNLARSLVNVAVSCSFSYLCRGVLRLLLSGRRRFSKAGSIHRELLPAEWLQRHHGRHGICRNYFPGPHAVGRGTNKESEESVGVLIPGFGEPGLRWTR